MTTPAQTPLPAGLRERVFAAAHAVRPAGRPVPEPPPTSPVEAFRGAARALQATLRELDDERWHLPAVRGLDVQGLVGHLTGVEQDLVRALSGDDEVAHADHVDSTQAVAMRQAGRAPAQTRREWVDAMARTLDLLGNEPDLDRVVSLHRVRMPLGALLVVRTFELWTHENDVRRAVGLPASVPEPGALALMTGLAAALLPRGVALVDDGSGPVDLHLVLTGPGGGTWDVAVGRAADGQVDPGDVPELVVVAEAVAFCRLVANRIRPDELDPHVSGAVETAPRILAGAAALALD